jgi:toluene monooxygenase system protein E
MSQPRRRRTFSAFGDVRKMPSEYEIMTHAQNWTTRANRSAAFEQNPSSPANLWFLTYRDNSPLRAQDWESFRDPDALTYRAYVTMQSDAEAATARLLEEYADAGADATLFPGQVSLLAAMFTPTRFLVHGCQQVQAYIGYMAPTSYITNAAGFATADLLKRVTLTAYRTRELQDAHPDSGIGTAERGRWEDDEAWQPARRAIEKALITYDWGEAFTAMNLVLAPTLDDVLLSQFREVSRQSGDELSWLLASYLKTDSDRRARWSAALATFCLRQRADNAEVLRRWIDKWSPVADAAARGLGGMLAGRSAEQVEAGARAAREELHGQVFGEKAEAAEVGATNGGAASR